MPNGGSDCCGTCWFNRASEDNLDGTPAEGAEHYCIIRNLPIEDPYYTYCANHPLHALAEIRTPIGPVFIGDCEGNREVWKEGPDTPETREMLLEILKRLPGSSKAEYPIGLALWEVVFVELVRLGERRALPELRRIAASKPIKTIWFDLTTEPIIEAARIAIDLIERGITEPPVEDDERDDEP